MAAGAAEGVGVWSLEPEDLSAVTMERFEPQINAKESEIRYSTWKKAVMKSMDWATKSSENGDTGIFSSLPLGFFVVSSMVMLIARLLKHNVIFSASLCHTDNFKLIRFSLARKLKACCLIPKMYISFTFLHPPGRLSNRSQPTLLNHPHPHTPPMCPHWQGLCNQHHRCPDNSSMSS